MSSCYQQTFECPRCGKKFEETVFQSVNSQWPDAERKIITGELFMYHCPHCGLKGFIESDVLYNDFEHNAWIQVVSVPEMIPTHEKMFETTEPYMPGICNRIVHNTSELRQKAMAFHMGRDDRVIELCKFAAGHYVKEQRKDLKLTKEPFYSINLDTGEEAILLEFEDGETGIYEIVEEFYQEMAKLFEKHATEEDRNRHVYDYAWAEEFFS